MITRLTSATLLVIIPSIWGHICDPGQLPDKIAISKSGEIALGCRQNECRRDFHQTEGRNSLPVCRDQIYELSCAGPTQWVGGIPKGTKLQDIVPLQCCSVEALRDTPQITSTKILEAGQMYEGKAFHDQFRNVVGYEVIRDVQKIQLGPDKSALSISISRYSCESRREAQLDNDKYDNHNQHQLFEEYVASEALAPPPQEHNLAIDQAPQHQAPPDFPPPPPSFQSSGGAGGEAFQPDPFFGDPIGAAPAADPFAAFAAPPPPLPLAAGGFGGGGAAGAACFATDTMVETPSGPLPIQDIQIGDEVLTVMNNEYTTFQPVTSFLHRLPNKKVNFNKISLADGSSVMLTPFHFIYTTPCGQVSPNMKYGRDVMPGECLIKIENNEKLTEMEIISNEIERAVGAFNPMTDGGTIVVNGYMASVHNVVNDQLFMNTMIRVVQRFQNILGFGESHDGNTIELPWIVQFLLEYANKLL